MKAALFPQPDRQGILVMMLKRIVRKTVRTGAPFVPLGLWRHLVPHSPVGFMYHMVSDADLPHVKHLYPYKSTAEFEADIRWIKRHYTLVGYEDLLAAAAGQRKLPEKAAYISFDDGFAECYTVVRPILLEHSVPCIFFLATDWVGNTKMYYKSKLSLVIEKRHSQITGRPGQGGTFSHPVEELRELQQSGENLIDKACEEAGVDAAAYLKEKQPFLKAEQVREMRADGFVFGGHTRSHHKLGFLSQAEQAEEIIESCRLVARITGDAQVPFAFPFSGSGVSRKMLADLRRRHPHVGLIFDTRKLRQEPGVLHRVWADKPVPGVAPEDNLAYWMKDAFLRAASEM